VQISIASTIVLRAERNKSMSIELVEGSAKLTTAKGSQTLKPGQVSTVTLGGANGLTATDAPSTPTAARSDATLAPVFETADKVADPDAPVNVAVDGCISAVNGNTITVNEYQINVGSDGTLKNAEVGDCVHIEGTLKIAAGNKVTLVVVRAQPRAGQSKSGTSGTSNNGNNGNGSGGGNGGSNGGSNGNAGGGGNGENGGGNGSTGGGGGGESGGGNGNAGGGGGGNGNNGNGNGGGNGNGNNGNGNGNGGGSGNCNGNGNGNGNQTGC
jgi:hypothetical protein